MYYSIKFTCNHVKTSWRPGWCVLTDLRNFQHYKIQISVTMPFAYRVYIVKEVRYEIISNENSYYFFLDHLSGFSHGSLLYVGRSGFFFGWSLCLLLGFTVIFFLELTFSLTDFFSFLTVSCLAPRLSDFVCTCLDAGKDGQTL